MHIILIFNRDTCIYLSIFIASIRLGNTDQFGLAVIADEAKGVVERSSRNGPTTMQRQIGFAEAESA
ncbi:hypothetical protein, partial [Burkholderia cenocepacia]|uniref:hypothetical protein n=1 Tax=Burkholderia cenocepacia TaxID=95486 RepID=UPI00264AE111